jgi:hypothetical protein
LRGAVKRMWFLGRKWLLERMKRETGSDVCNERWLVLAKKALGFIHVELCGSWQT